MTPLEHALNDIDLEQIEKEAIPETELLKEHWTLDYLDRLGRPPGISYTTKKGITNKIIKTWHTF